MASEAVRDGAALARTAGRNRDATFRHEFVSFGVYVDENGFQMLAPRPPSSSVVSLTMTELALLELLLRRSPRVVTRQTIATQVWDDEVDAVGSNTFDVHVGRLRPKLAGSQTRIEMVRGTGYRLVTV